MSPIFPLHFQGAVLEILLRTFLLTSTGLSPFIVFLSRKLRISKKVLMEVYHTTSPLHYCNRFSLNYTVFSRSYSRHPNWFLFLQVLRRFNSLRSQSFRISRSYEDTFRSLWFKAYVRLAKAFCSLSHPSSAFRA